MTFTDINALSAQLFPDIGTRAITPADIRQIVTALAAGVSGSNFEYRTIDVNNYGSVISITGAASSQMVVRNGITLTPGTDYSFAAASGNGVWTFAAPLMLTETILIVWA